MSKRSLLLELGCEELPSSNLRQLGESLNEKLSEQLSARGLTHNTSQWFASPRRLAVLIQDLIEQGDDETQEALGPPLAQAKDAEGNWSRAAQGFASKQGVAPEDLTVFDTPKGQRLGIQRVVAGEKTVDCLLEIVNQAIAELPIAKRMRWGASRREFVRPVHWIVLLYGEKSDFGDVLGIPCGRTTHGHRFHAPEAIELQRADDYESSLRNAQVIADFSERRDIIRQQVQTAAEAQGGKALLDPQLLDEVCSLVEWPVALSGSFDKEFLEIPAEALISSMQSHQKYFPLVDENNSLLARFVTVSNIESRDPAQVIAGNERVIRPRLADAAFFFRQDLKQSLESRLSKLGDVLFQQKLGSVLDKTHRIEKLAEALAEKLGAEPALAKRAAKLSKTDLVSDMVLEFSEMQGIAGAYYARNDGEDATVADAVQQHYWPTKSGGELPQSPTARCVALADRLDTLVGIFGIGQIPSGSKDPFALRRASIAVLRILIKEALDLDLRDCLSMAIAGYGPAVLDEATSDLVLNYMLDRIPALYEDEPMPVETFRAVRMAGCSHPLDFDRRLRAVQTFMARQEAEALAAANKRVSNILAKAEAQNETSEVSTNLLQEAEEKALFAAIEAIGSKNTELLKDGDYSAALSSLATLRAPVDAFFDKVMVNAEDPSLKENRLALLSQLRREFMAIADISQLAT